MFSYKKSVDKSVLCDGLSIPLQYHKLLQMVIPEIQNHGAKKQIKILIDGEFYDAYLKNVAFDQQKHKGHVDVIQIRYAPQSPISKKLREIFYTTNAYLEGVRKEQAQDDKTYIKIPDEIKEFLYISTTSAKDVFSFEYFTQDEEIALKTDILKIPEGTFETLSLDSLKDENTGFSQAIRKIRKLDKSIGDTLKKFYDYRCQLTGERIGEPYGAHVVEAHHIVPFTESLNNDASNIIIINPTFHRIIHKAKPEFDNATFSFKFPNGVVEKLKLTDHLR